MEGFNIENLIRKGYTLQKDGSWAKGGKQSTKKPKVAVMKPNRVTSPFTIHEQEIKIKPLSVNRVWAGKRFKTPEYKKYEKEVLNALIDKPIPSSPYKLEIVFYMSNVMSDIDNPVKPLQDLLQKKFSFNDRHIMELHVKKVKVKKGEEKIFYCITNLSI